MARWVTVILAMLWGGAITISLAFIAEIVIENVPPEMLKDAFMLFSALCFISAVLITVSCLTTQIDDRSLYAKGSSDAEE